MTDVTATKHPSRRRFIGAAIASTVLASPAAAMSPDAGLIRLGQELDARWALERSVPRGSSDEVYQAAYDACAEIVDQIEAIPAETLQGIQVKARAVYWCLDGDFANFELDDQQTTDVRLAQQIVRSLLNIRPILLSS